ncbi:TPA: archease [Legionella pneumophila]|uniref:Archease n=1 Tax=Legionella pneumophila TaxID=446 RepID=A0AAN5T148_LEGPN|nr:archease [Legionella pneumophila]OOD08681.1 protein archease [Legionella pneumophila subsp. pneumophila ATCC 43290]MCW8390087.1 archease [Legionella pneumophila]MCW8438306.1 archease [Legionella pneumophila]MCW8480726.1 archease [Legionella pneumophila]MCW8492380.1 archease [Legionella pneumophila]
MHEADIGVRGIGPTLPDAFEMGALALTNVVADAALIKPSLSIKIHCEAPNEEILFTDWLNAVVYNMQIHNMLFREFDVKLNRFVLDAVIRGEKVDQKKHQPVVEVKGATYTELKIYKNNGIWIAQCVVDV